jgi:hypothetical protein
VDEALEYVSVKANIDGVYNVLIIGTRKDPSAIAFWDEQGGAEIPPCI